MFERLFSSPQKSNGLAQVNGRLWSVRLWSVRLWSVLFHTVASNSVFSHSVYSGTGRLFLPTVSLRSVFAFPQSRRSQFINVVPLSLLHHSLIADWFHGLRFIYSGVVCSDIMSKLTVNMKRIVVTPISKRS